MKKSENNGATVEFILENVSVQAIANDCQSGYFNQCQ